MDWGKDTLEVFLFGFSCGMAFVNGLRALIHADRHAQEDRHRWHDDG